MSNGVDRELGETDARLAALEKRMATQEARMDEILRVLYMGRGVAWVGGLIAAGTAVVWTVLQIFGATRGH